MNAQERYPLAVAALARLRASTEQARSSAVSLRPFRLGPQVLRAPPAVAAGRLDLAPDDAEGVAPAGDPEDLLGELVDMVLVGAQDGGGQTPEVRLQFKASVLGGLFLRLQAFPEGLCATFTVADAAARRAIVEHAEALVAHLRRRGFSVVRYDVAIDGPQVGS